MNPVHTLVIGAGQAGLAVSRSLTDAAVDHVVVERGRLGERWRSERWDSLRLLTPNWASRLPGWSYDGADPHGFMTAGELVAYFEAYARSFGAPVHEGTAVRRVERAADGFTVRTDGPTWHAGNVVIATGWCDRPLVPGFASGLDPSITQLTPSAYRNPGQLPDGGVLVVGGSASGVQLADELARSGRDVVLAVGRHNRLPRTYRGLDIWRWLESIGTFAKTIDQMGDAEQARHEGSLQLVGRADRRDVDLPALQAAGVRVTGRVLSAEGSVVGVADDLGETTSAADARLARVLADVDRHIARHGLDRDVPAAGPISRVAVPPPVPRLDLRGERISTVVWATGFTRSYPWLAVPVLDGAGEIAQQRGVTGVPGLYVLGQRFQHRRDSNFIDGVRHDAAFVTRHILRRVRLRGPVAA